MSAEIDAVIDRIQRQVNAAARIARSFGFTIEKSHQTIEMLRRQAADEGEWR